jgi:hypothetical protein
MDRTLALFIITWSVMLLLYLGLARVLYDLHGLRRRVERLSAQSAPAASSLPLELPTGTFGGVDVLLAVESSCPRCWMVAEWIIENASTRQAALLTYEDPTVWSPFSDRIRIIQSESAWASITHLSPPVLLRLDPAGSAVTDIFLPVGESDLRTTLDLWDSPTKEAVE